MTKETAPSVEAIADVDLDALDVQKFASEGTEVAILHPVSKKPIGLYIGVMGQNSETYKEIIRERSNEAMNRAVTAGIMGEDPKPYSFEEQQERELNLLAALTTGWRQENGKQSVKFGGVEYEFTMNNVKLIYRRFDFIKDQVDKAIADVSRFIKG